MSKYFPPVSVLSLALLLLAVPSALPAQSAVHPCRTLDFDGEDFRAGVIRMDTAQTAGAREVRSRLGIPIVSPDSVTLVLDPAICRQAAVAQARLVGPDARNRGVYVMRLGTYYVVYQPDGHAGILAGVFDRTFKHHDLWGM